MLGGRNEPCLRLSPFRSLGFLFCKMGTMIPSFRQVVRVGAPCGPGTGHTAAAGVLPRGGTRDGDHPSVQDRVGALR